jgi:hypothetical protein
MYWHVRPKKGRTESCKISCLKKIWRGVAYVLGLRLVNAPSPPLPLRANKCQCGAPHNRRDGYRVCIHGKTTSFHRRHNNFACRLLQLESWGTFWATNFPPNTVLADNLRELTGSLMCQSESIKAASNNCCSWRNNLCSLVKKNCTAVEITTKYYKICVFLLYFPGYIVLYTVSKDL